LGIIARREEDWSRAVDFWEQAAKDHFAACVELSKYYEHQARDFEKAAIWSEKALSLVYQSNDLQPGKPAIIIKEIQHRLQRINKKNQAAEG
jgi:uncharacterized protein HemY